MATPLTRTRTLSLAALLTLAVAGASFASADDPPKGNDEALDALLKKLEDPKPAADPKPSKDDAKAPSKGEAKAPAKDAKAGKAAGKPKGEVESRDKDLDGLLEKLGETGDKPSADDKPAGPGAPGEPKPGEPAPGQPDPKKKKDDPNALTGQARDLDEHLEELTGKKRKKNRRQEEEDGSPLSDVIKQMRDVEERLGKSETGEETRKKEEQIVKRLDTLIEQMRSSQSRMRMRQMAMGKGGQRPDRPGENPGTTGGNAPFTKPQKPTGQRSMAGGKDEWGHLPAELRQEMENVFKEEPLPSREDLIKRYYLSLNKKSSKRGE